MALPVGFLPFDPKHDNKDSDDDEEDEEESCSESDSEIKEDTTHDSLTNGETNHEEKQKKHIGGGVILVRNGFIKTFSIEENHTEKSKMIQFFFLLSLGFSQRMCFGCNVSCSYKKDYKQTSNRSINGRWTNFSSTCLLYIKARMSTK